MGKGYETFAWLATDQNQRAEARSDLNTCGRLRGGRSDLLSISGNTQLFSGMRLLALDPALRCSGFAVLEKNGRSLSSLAYGVIKNPSAHSMPQCLLEIHRRIYQLIETHRPAVCAVESIIYVQNSRTAIILGAARGAALLAAAQHGLEIYEYPPRRVKQAIVGKGGAQKPQVAFMVRALLGLAETPDPDSADAIAIGLTHLQMAESPIATRARVCL